MSLPLGDLLKSLAPARPPPVSEGWLNNPDIPVSRTIKSPPKQDLSASNMTPTKSQWYNAMKLTSAPRNGDGYSLARAPGLPGLNPKRQEFMLDGAIDPANIRARHNPLKAPPAGYATGLESFEYQEPLSTRTSEDSVPLVQKARQSYANRLNRLQPLQSTQPKDVQSYLAATGKIGGVPTIGKPT